MKVLSIMVLFLSIGLLLASTQRVLLTSIQSFVVKEGVMAKASRTAALPQLICAGPNCAYGPRSVLCKNVGHNGVDVNWQCEGEMPPGLRFDRIEVSCEGYAYPDDPYILADSCSVSYTLIGYPTNQDDAKAFLASRTMPLPPPILSGPPPIMIHVPPPPSPTRGSMENNLLADALSIFLSFILFFGILILVLGCMCTGFQKSSPPSNGGGGGPGFWSGMGIGSLAGWSLASSRNRHSSPPSTSSPSRELTHSTTSVAYSGTSRKEEKKDYPATSIGYSGTSRKKEKDTTTSTGVTTTTRR